MDNSTSKDDFGGETKNETKKTKVNFKISSLSWFIILDVLIRRTNLVIQSTNKYH